MESRKGRHWPATTSSVCTGGRSTCRADSDIRSLQINCDCVWIRRALRSRIPGLCPPIESPSKELVRWLPSGPIIGLAWEWKRVPSVRAAAPESRVLHHVPARSSPRGKQGQLLRRSNEPLAPFLPFGLGGVVRTRKCRCQVYLPNPQRRSVRPLGADST